MRRTLALLAAACVPLPACPQDADIGRDLAATCATCHGSNGRAGGEFKPLAGRSSEEITEALADFRSGAKPATVMHQIAKGYSADQIRRIAGYFASQPARP